MIVFANETTSKIFKCFLDYKVEERAICMLMYKMILDDLYLVHKYLPTENTPFLSRSDRTFYSFLPLSYEELLFLVTYIGISIIDSDEETILKFVDNVAQSYCIPQEYIDNYKLICSQQQ
jgi:hypothetical protein